MSSSSARDIILERIRKALTRDPGQHVAAANHSRDEARKFASNADPQGADTTVLSDQFEAELAAVGGLFYRASNAAAACDCVLRIAAAHNAQKVIGWDVRLIEELDLAARLGTAGVDFFPENAYALPADFQVATVADIGITSVDYALAETGTLVLRSGAGRARSVSLLPPVHIALLKPDQIVPGLDQLFPMLARDQLVGRLDSALTFITGPSRTADIELTLVVGVHGPQELHVILLDAPAEKGD